MRAAASCGCCRAAWSFSPRHLPRPPQLRHTRASAALALLAAAAPSCFLRLRGCAACCSARCPRVVSGRHLRRDKRRRMPPAWDRCVPLEHVYRPAQPADLHRKKEEPVVTGPAFALQSTVPRATGAFPLFILTPKSLSQPMLLCCLCFFCSDTTISHLSSPEHLHLRACRMPTPGAEILTKRLPHPPSPAATPANANGHTSSLKYCTRCPLFGDAATPVRRVWRVAPEQTAHGTAENGQHGKILLLMRQLCVPQVRDAGAAWEDEG